MKELKAACIQMMVNPDDYKANIDKAINLLDRAILLHKPDLVVFPETITTGFAISKSFEEFYDSLDEVPGALTKKICEKAKKENIHIVWPTYERCNKEYKIYNSVLLIDNKGNIVGNYRKTHLFPTERLEKGGYSSPGNEVVVVDTELGKIGLICCYDGDFPELSRACALKGAEIIVRPSAFLRSFEIWELTNKARAYDNHVYMIAANAIGPDAKNNVYFGHSMIVSPKAETLAQSRCIEDIICAELKPDNLTEIGYGSQSPMLFNHLKDRNIASYKTLADEIYNSVSSTTEEEEKELVLL